MNQFTIDSEFGVFQADGSEMLLQRVKEIYTIAKLKECFTDGIRGTQARAGCNIRPDVAPLATGTANSRNYGARSIQSGPA